MLQQHPMYAYIPARVLARARAFYEQKVGLKPKQEVAGGVVYEFAGGTARFLSRRPTRARRGPARRSGRSTTSTAKSKS